MLNAVDSLYFVTDTFCGTSSRNGTVILEVMVQRARRETNHIMKLSRQYPISRLSTKVS